MTLADKVSWRYMARYFALLTYNNWKIIMITKKTSTIIPIALACVAITGCKKVSCDNDILKGEALGIKAVPTSFGAGYSNKFCKYTSVIAKNGKHIGFFAQDKISNDQLIRARSILEFYLTDVPGSLYGSDKTNVANAMANNEAKLLLLNGSDDGTNNPTVDGQPLYDTELVTEGSTAYINNDYENHRDAAFEEILHLMHDYGIGTSGPDAAPGALPLFTASIDTARSNAMTNSFWPTQNVDASITQWIAELEKEGSLSQEYLASVIDSYYGYWGADTTNQGGMGGIYIAKNRDEVSTLDPMGSSVINEFFNPVVTYMARIDSAFQGYFSLTFDVTAPYTHKSQYLVSAQLTGNFDSNLIGNEYDNFLAGNAGTNNIDGLAGVDTAVFQGKHEEYSVNIISGNVLVQDSVSDRNGLVTLNNIELLTFSDKTFEFEAGSLTEK